MRTEGRHTRWSAFTFQTQLLPLTVPVTVSVVERFDAVRAARHEAARDALRRAAHAPSTCPGCGHDLAQPAAAQEHPATRTGPAVAGGVLRRRSEAEVAAAARMWVVVEALVGRRPLSQLAGLAETSVLRWARAEGHRLRSSRESAQLLSVGVQQTRAETAELFGSVRLGGRLHAYAGQLEGRRGAWAITELRILRPSCSRGRRERHGHSEVSRGRQLR